MGWRMEQRLWSSTRATGPMCWCVAVGPVATVPRVGPGWSNGPMVVNVRRAVLQQLGGGGESRFGSPYLVGAVRQQANCTAGEVWEALWALVGEGLVYLDTAGQGWGTDNWQWRLSADGRRVAQGGSYEPRDLDGYLERLRREIPSLDELVELYLIEALRSFNSRCYLATSVMLGVAAERAFLVMARAYAASSVAGAAALGRELGKPRGNYFALWTEFRKRIEPVRADLPNGLADALTLDAVADLIRLTRNEAGHPSGRQIDEDTARVHLTIAPMYLRKMDQLTAHFAERLAAGHEDTVPADVRGAVG